MINFLIGPKRSHRENAVNLHSFEWPAGGWHHWFQNEVQMRVSLWASDPTSHLSYYHSKQFMVYGSVASFKSIQPDVHFVDNGAI